MPWAVAAAVGGALISADASGDAAETQADASRDASASQERIFNRQVELQEPWREAGIDALGQLTSGLGPGGQFSRGFTFTQDDPGYQFRLSQGRDALESSAAARGLNLSGATLKALVDYGQQAGSQEYGASYNRWNNDVTNRFNRLASVAGIGQTATRDVSQAAGNFGNSLAELSLQGANARAAGQVGTANAITGGLSTLGNWWQRQQPSTSTAGGGGIDTSSFRWDDPYASPGYVGGDYGE